MADHESAWLLGSGLTAYGRHDGDDALDLMSEAAALALADAGLARADIDGLLCGYATTLPHLMLANVLAEHFGLSPAYAHAIQMGGATRSTKYRSARRSRPTMPSSRRATCTSPARPRPISPNSPC